MSPASSWRRLVTARLSRTACKPDPGLEPVAASARTVVAHSGPAAAKGDDGETRGLVGRTVADVERDLILETLQHCLGNRTHAANILGISIRTLRNKLRLYNQEGIRVPAPGESDGAAA